MSYIGGICQKTNLEGFFHLSPHSADSLYLGALKLGDFQVAGEHVLKRSFGSYMTIPL